MFALESNSKLDEMRLRKQTQSCERWWGGNIHAGEPLSHVLQGAENFISWKFHQDAAAFSHLSCREGELMSNFMIPALAVKQRRNKETKKWNQYEPRVSTQHGTGERLPERQLGNLERFKTFAFSFALCIYNVFKKIILSSQTGTCVWGLPLERNRYVYAPIHSASEVTTASSTRAHRSLGWKQYVQTKLSSKQYTECSLNCKWGLLLHLLAVGARSAPNHAALTGSCRLPLGNAGRLRFIPQWPWISSSNCRFWGHTQFVRLGD